MHDDDAGERGTVDANAADGQPGSGASHDIFGGYSVVGPGVEIMLEGRPVSNPRG